MSEEQHNKARDEIVEAARKATEAAAAADREREAGAPGTESGSGRTAAGTAGEGAGPAGGPAAGAAAGESGSGRTVGGSTAAAAGATDADAGAGAAPGRHAKPATVGAGSRDAGATGVTGTFEAVGEGAPRYADRPDEVPRTGSEQSWSSAPHPGYAPDPRAGYTNKRVAAGTLIGCLVLALGVFYGTRILTGRSSNGFGAAPWTAAVQQDGAVVRGINAQNSGVAPPVVVPSGIDFATGGGDASEAVVKAVDACQDVARPNSQLTTGPGATASVSAWGAQAKPTLDGLKAAAAKLEAAIATKDQAAVAEAAHGMCASFTTLDTLPAMPDVAGSRALASGVTAYAQAASNALKGVSGEPSALQTAADDVRLGNEQFAALDARIATASA